MAVDGPDAATRTSLANINTSRLRTLPLERNVVLTEARSAGVQSAPGQWIAFLDYDDLNAAG